LILFCLFVRPGATLAEPPDERNTELHVPGALPAMTPQHPM